MDHTINYLCPCCNKLVPGSHFRRAPWTMEDVAELLNRPQFVAALRRAVKEELLATAPTMQRTGMHKQYVRHLVPPGWWTCEQAAAELRKAHPGSEHFNNRTVQQYISIGRLEGGNGFVLASSMKALITKYKVRKRRTTKHPAP